MKKIKLEKVTKANKKSTAVKTDHKTAINSPLPSGLAILKESLSILRTNWRFFGGILLVYVGINILLVRSFNTSIDLPGLKKNLIDSGQVSGGFNTGFALYGFLLGSASTTGEGIAGAYQTVLLLLTSLATVFGLRNIFANKTVTVKEAYYNSGTQFVPVLLVLGVFLIQLIPFFIGATIYNTALDSGAVASIIEQTVFAIIYFGMALVSLYLVSSTAIALYIVALPSIMPKQALASAKKLIKDRRMSIMRKLIFLPFVLILVISTVMLPVLIWAVSIAQYVYFVTGMLATVVVHAYMYTLYRRLLA